MRRMPAVAALVLSFLLPALAAGDPPGPSFRGVGDAPGGGFLSKAYGVSANGRYVVGATEVVIPPFGPDTLEAFRWEDGALETLGRIAQLQTSCVFNPCTGGSVSTDMSEAFAVAADGSAVGRVCITTGSGPQQCAAARFGDSSPVPLQPELHLLEAGYEWQDGDATDVTADGSAIYGSYQLVYLSSNDNYGGIFRWQDSAATVLASALWLNARYWGMKVSPDGEAYAHTAVDWEDPVDHVVLHRLGGDTNLGPGAVHDVSKLGLVVVGQASAQAARWHGGSVTLLGDLPGGDEASSALAVSDAGHVIAGWGTSAAGQEAFLWTPESGMQRLADVLSDHGLDLSGWTLEQATGLSASGRTVVGWGTNPSGDTEGFVATLPARTIPTPSLGPLGLAVLVGMLIAAASAAVWRGQGASTSPARR